MKNYPSAFRFTASTRSGFTLVELLTTIAVIAILVAILVPAVSAVRENSRKAACQNNLRQIGIGLQAFSDSDSKQRFSSGAISFVHDGCPDTTGWMADLNRLGSLDAELGLCPSNPARGSVVLQQQLDLNTNDASITGKPQDVSAGYCVKFNPSDSGYLATGMPRTGYLDLQVTKGFNTNYAASWFLVRGQVTQDGLGSGAGGKTGFARGPFLEKQYTQGGLKQANLAILSKDDPPANNIPLMGDGNGGRTRLTTAINETLPQGAALAENFTQGPAVYDATTKKIVLAQGSAGNVLLLSALMPDKFPQGGEIVTPADEINYQTTAGDWTATPGGAAGQQRLCLQDTRAWQAVHRGTCNILMADGSVKSISDQNGDGFLNPGFPVDDSSGGAGYTSGLTEMQSYDVYSGVLLHFDKDRY